MLWRKLNQLFRLCGRVVREAFFEQVTFDWEVNIVRREDPEEENCRGEKSAKELFGIWVQTIADHSKGAKEKKYWKSGRMLRLLYQYLVLSLSVYLVTTVCQAKALGIEGANPTQTHPSLVIRSLWVSKSV